MATLGTLSVQLEANIVRFNEAMDRAAAIADRNARHIEDSFNSMGRRLGSSLGVALGGALSMGAIKSATSAIVEAGRLGEESVNRLNAVLRATGNQSGYTADQLHKLADQMARTTQFDDEGFRDATATLLKFGNLSGETLKRSLKLSADWAALTKGDVTSAAETLGKALASPSKGIDRLQRQVGDLGEAFVQSVKDMDAMGNSAGAQAALLEKLEGKIGGVAEMMNTGLTKATKDLEKSWDELKEEIGRNPLVKGAVEMALEGVTKKVQGLKTVFEGDWVTTALKLAALQGSFLLGGAGAVLNFLGGEKPPDVGPPAGKPADQKPFDLSGQDARALEILAKKTAEYEKELKALYDRLDDGATSVAPKFWRELKILNDEFAKGAMKQDAYVRRVEELIKGTDFAKEATKGLLAAAKANNEEVERAIELDQRKQDAINAQIRDVREYAEQLEFETAIMGLSNAERAKAIALRQLEASKAQLSATEIEKLTNRIRDAVNAQEAIRNQLSIWDQLGDLVAGFGRAIISGPKSAIDYMRQSLKQFAAEMAAVFAKRWFLQIIAGVTGSTALGTMAGQVGQGTLGGAGASLFGNVLGGGMNLLSGGGFGGGVGLGIGAGVDSLAINAASTLGLGNAASGMLIQGAGMLAAALPWVAAAIAIYSMFAKPGGGPKEGGSFMGAFSGSGDFLANMPVSGTDNGRFFTPNGQDSMARSLGTNTAAGYFSTLGLLGGTSTGAQFGLGFDTDPRGTADNRISSSVIIGGREVFGSRDRGVGRDQAELESQLALESQRMILAALQASDLPSAVGAILDTVDAATASGDAIDQVLKLAVAFQDLQKSLADFDADKILEQANRSSSDVFRDQGKALLELSRSSTLTLESLQQLSAATIDYKNAAAQLILSFENAKRQIGEMFGETGRNIRMSSMNDQGKYDFLMKESESLFAQLQAATSAEEITRLAGLIDRNINAAFGMLSPEQQFQMQKQFLDRLDNVNKITQERLAKLQEQAIKDTKEVLKDVGDKLTKLTDSLTPAAAKMDNAADKMVASTPQTVRVEVEDRRVSASLVNNGG